MKRIIIQVLFAIIGAAVGSSFLPYFWSAIGQNQLKDNSVVNSIIGAIIFVLLSFIFKNAILRMFRKVDEALGRLNILNVGTSFIGAVLGLIVGALLSISVWALNIPFVSSVGPFILMISFMYIGYSLFSRRGKEIFSLFNRKKVMVEPEVKEEKTIVEVSGEQATYKLLDTSAIIDGRIIDVLKTGFVEGTILIPNFVIFELQLIADNNDKLKRAKGRRGLDLVNELQKLKNIKVETTDVDYDDINEVDTKLLRLASDIKGSLVTTDYNLNKVAEIQKVTVLNINGLANAVKPQVVVGEEIDVTIVKKGSERHQGIGYMPDGTMIVVEDTDNLIDKTVKAEVTSALQTNAGRMIFAKLLED